MTKKKQTIFVGMSGGVDSSVSAALLKQQGFDVVGVFIKGWYPDFITCNWKQERRDAMRVAAHLGIPFMTCDASKEYEEEVAKYLISEYKVGRTPNPDVMCNKYVKFGVFYNWAREQGTDYIATGHYAQTDGKFLLESTDSEKDQTYFLWTLPQEELAHIKFPIGDFTKSHVRALARAFHLPVSEKKDSQGICFLGKVSMKDFLLQYVDAQPGGVLNEEGEVIGTHEGALIYTLGQRHGFTITKKGSHDVPYKVSAKNMDTNTVTVVPATDTVAQQVSEIELTDVNEIYNFPSQAEVRIRYRAPKVPAKIIKRDSGIRVVFDTPQQFVTPGQSCVIYSGTTCCGGGIIK